MRTHADLSAREARWLAIGAQGLGSDRPGPVGTRSSSGRLRRLLDQLGALQLDAVNVLDRTQFLVPFSRIGRYDRTSLLGLTGPGGTAFEYWGHAASLQPTALYPLFRWRMDEWRHHAAAGSKAHLRRREWRETHAEYLTAVLSDVAERGPLAASQLADPRRRAGEWWDRRSDGRRALELLFADGTLAAWRNPNFERVYDLTERVIPAEILALPTPDEKDAQRALIDRAAQALGVATEQDLRDYFRLGPDDSRLAIESLVEAGVLMPVEVPGWARLAYLHRDARRPRRVSARALLAPFDPLVWERSRTLRLFDFHYRIEIYTPADKRQHGYYVLPFLLGDLLVARLDLKADRQAGRLLVHAVHLESHAPSDVMDAMSEELQALAGWLGLPEVVMPSKPLRRSSD